MSGAAPNIAAGVGCDAVKQALADLNALDRDLYPETYTANEITKNTADWISTIDNQFQQPNTTGPQAVQVAITKIDKYREGLDGDKGAYTLAKAKLKEIFEDGKKDAMPVSDSCTLAARSIYQTIRLADPYRRLGELGQLVQTLKDLSTRLGETYGQDSDWLGDNYIVQELTPKPDKVQKVVIKLLNVKLPVNGLGVLSSTAQEEAASTTFSLRQYSSFAPEIGAGVVAAFVDQPKYGTTTNASGKTIVALAKKNSVSVDPTVMVNFVCRCGSNPFFEPMLQVGVAASKSVPAILFGGGIRLFSLGKGDVGVGGGLALVWIEDLTHLSVGDPVSGTKDIEQDLSFNHAPKPRPYFTLQYKF